MMEKELIKIWRSSPREEQVKFEKSRLLIDVQSSLDHFRRSMKWLYFRESLGAFIAIPMFIYFGFIAPNILTKIGLLLIAVWAVYLLYVIRQSKKEAPDRLMMSYLDYLKEMKAYLKSSKRNRETVLIWYVLPFVFSTWLAMAGEYLENPDRLTGALVISVIALVVGGGVYLMNRRSAERVVAPKLEKVVGLIEAMEE